MSSNSSAVTSIRNWKASSRRKPLPSTTRRSHQWKPLRRASRLWRHPPNQRHPDASIISHAKLHPSTSSIRLARPTLAKHIPQESLQTLISPLSTPDIIRMEGWPRSYLSLQRRISGRSALERITRIMEDAPLPSRMSGGRTAARCRAPPLRDSMRGE